MNEEVVKDCLNRCRSILFDTIKIELCWQAWGPIPEPPHGPCWKGKRGTYPLLPFIEKALNELEHNKKISDNVEDRGKK